MNRIGDLGFVSWNIHLGNLFSTLDYATLKRLQLRQILICTCLLLLLFIGACGKSAQIPLYNWLQIPDAYDQRRFQH
jgi:NADH-quinone oxidoreductase subunit L